MTSQVWLSANIANLYATRMWATCADTAGHMMMLGDTGDDYSYQDPIPAEVELPEQMYCAYCWSEWNDALYHPGTCTNCGAPKYKAMKPESEMRWSYEYEEEGEDDDDE